MRDPFAPGLLAELDRVDAVVVVRPSRLGDLLCAGPAIEALKAARPGAEITLVALPLARDLAQRLPGVDHVEPFPGWPGIAEQLFDARRSLRSVAALQRRRFDLAVQLYGSGVNANPFTLLLGARHTAGFVRPGDPAGRLDAALPLEEGGHEVERMLALPRFLAADPIPSVPPHPRLVLRTGDHRAADHLLGDLPRPLVGVHPGARDAERRWPVLQALGTLVAVHTVLGGSLVVLGDTEAPDVARPLDRIGMPVVDLRDRLGLGPLAALLGRLDVLITTDSGPAHLAYAAGTPTVTLVGPSDPGRHGPPPGPHHVLRVAHDHTGLRPRAADVLAAATAAIGRPALAV